MNNELPQGLIDLTSSGKLKSKKAYKLVSILFTGKCATGRIKRMRNPKKIQDYHRGYSVRLKATKDKFKIWDMLWYQNQEFSYPFTRWNKH